MTKRILFLGGNGHDRSRILVARSRLAERGIELVDAPYPGFEGRPAALDFERFLLALTPCFDEGQDLVYATGIGGLIALALRARDVGLSTPLVIQGGVLFGLEDRLFPKLMRGPLPYVLQHLFRYDFVQRRFAARHFERPPTSAERAAFFDGYRQCRAFTQFFRWFRPALLRSLELELQGHEKRLANVSGLWGARDHVVPPAEFETTRDRLGANWNLRVLESWGHYPMIDAPDAWAEEVARALA